MHVDPDLSAYLDGELPAADRARVEAHLATCESCAQRLRELRATAALIASLPSPRAARSLVPALTPRWNWLRPVRSLSAFATGAFLFAFLITVVGRSGAGLGGGDASTAIFSRGAGAAPAPAASAASVPVAAPPASVPAPVLAEPKQAQQGAASAAPTAADTARFEAARSAAAKTRGAPAQEARTAEMSVLTDPRLWLALAILAAIVALAAHRRLRAG